MNISEFDIASRRERLTAALTVAGLVVIALALLPAASVMGEVITAFLPAVLTAAMLVALLTAYLLTTEWRVMKHSPHGILASGYFFAGMCLLGQNILFPSLDITGDTAFSNIVWLGCIWHLIFPLYAILYAAIQGRWVPFSPTSVKAIAWAGFAGVFVTYAVVRAEILPPVYADGHFTDIYYRGLGYAMICLNLAAATLTALRTGGRIRQDLWLSIVLVSFGIEIMLSMQGYARYSIGWYAGRIFMLTGITTMLVVMIHRLIRNSYRLQEANANLSLLAQTDGLTNLGNRRAYDEKLAVYQRIVKRDKCPLTLLVIDIDFFKQYNDTYGHAAGDRALQRIAYILSSQIYRPLDFAARIGGEEFALLLPDTDEAEARMVAERLRLSVRNLRLPHEKGIGQHMTISIGGVIIHPGDAVPPTELFEAADRALYNAKRAGRNVVSFAADPAETEALTA